MKKWIGLAVILLFVAGGVVTWFFYWKNAQLYPSTDDAYVAGDIYQISSRIPGTILNLDVDDNQPVAKGQVVATIDPEQYDREVDQAQAALAQARTIPARNRAKIAEAQASRRLPAPSSWRGPTSPASPSSSRGARFRSAPTIRR